MNKISLWAMSLLYITAGSFHFINPAFYLQIMPPFLPWPITLIYASGIFEIAFGLLLIPWRTRYIASWLIIILLLAIFPANIYMAVKYWQTSHAYYWLALLRLPLQFVLIWWAIKVGRIKSDRLLIDI